jgi:hypothetical protein
MTESYRRHKPQHARENYMIELIPSTPRDITIVAASMRSRLAVFKFSPAQTWGLPSVKTMNS